ncbi:MAG: M81 family metallopeptidase, partial [Alphaproteobacteria bacterium]
MAFRVLTGELQHETNTFSRVATPLAAFRARQYLESDESLAALAGTASELAGVQDVALQHGWTLVPTIAASATPSGLVTAAAWEHLSGRILDAADSTIDGVVLGLHGAMVCDGVEDAEGDLLARLRQRLRPGVPVAITLDLHANLTEAMARHADIVLCYRTYPHVDAREVAQEASRLVHRAMAGEIRPHTRLYRGAALDGLNHGRTQSPPMTTALEMAADAVAADDRLLVVSLAAGFTYADIGDAGPGVTVTWDDSRHGGASRADALGRDLWRFIWQSRADKTEVMWTPQEMARHARAGETADDRARGPLLVADSTDNPGGGSYGDNVRALAALLDAGCSDALVASICDRECAAACHAAGVGAALDLILGSKVDPALYGPPLSVHATVESLHDGAFTYDGPMYAGTRGTLGPT